MNLVFFDNKSHETLLPLTYTRPAADLRIGILKISEKWEKSLGGVTAGYVSQMHLSKKYSIPVKADLYLASNVIPEHYLMAEIKALSIGQKLESFGNCIAFKSTQCFHDLPALNEALANAESIESDSTPISVSSAIDIFKRNGDQIQKDIDVLKLETVSSYGLYNTLIGSQFYIDPTVKMEGVTLNSTEGPIYLGKDVEVMEGSVIRGPFAALEHSTVKMASKIYGDTTIGPHCKVGGEVSNSVFYGYSNKGHDGFLGNSVIGEWCNLGADTNSSNLKNNYSNVSVWNYSTESIENTNEIFVGLIMGDHSKTGINTMLNTGTVVGVSANIYGGDFPPKFIPSFSWGGSSGFQTFNFEKAKEVANKMMQRRGLDLTDEDSSILEFAYKADSKFR
ncbi:MAG: putative sugar nucleotidyl transferase [Salibacteraceae bacterium]|nr:putative sugar nucleotidyl transferase [Salibacteraceae bacterium]|tara:strand:- start:24899 stop:26077 length:1179 start_codon:yes stop_codon:yes gene_type:complete